MLLHKHYIISIVKCIIATYNYHLIEFIKILRRKHIYQQTRQLQLQQHQQQQHQEQQQHQDTLSHR